MTDLLIAAYISLALTTGFHTIRAIDRHLGIDVNDLGDLMLTSIMTVIAAAIWPVILALGVVSLIVKATVDHD